MYNKVTLKMLGLPFSLKLAENASFDNCAFTKR